MNRRLWTAVNRHDTQKLYVFEMWPKSFEYYLLFYLPNNLFIGNHFLFVFLCFLLFTQFILIYYKNSPGVQSTKIVWWILSDVKPFHYKITDQMLLLLFSNQTDFYGARLLVPDTTDSKSKFFILLNLLLSKAKKPSLLFIYINIFDEVGVIIRNRKIQTILTADKITPYFILLNANIYRIIYLNFIIKNDQIIRSSVMG